MSNAEITDAQLIKRYLLGIASAAEQEQIETELFLNDDYLGRLQIIEDELIENYVSNRLSQTEKQHFEQHFMAAPERQTSVNHALLLRNYYFDQIADETESTHPSKSTQRTDWLFWLFKGRYAFPMLALLSIGLATFVLAIWYGNQFQGIDAKSKKQNQSQPQSNELSVEVQPQQPSTQQSQKPVILDEKNLSKPDLAKTEEKSLVNKNENGTSRSADSMLKRSAPNFNKQLLSKSSIKKRAIDLALIAGQTMSTNDEQKVVKLTPVIKILRLQLYLEGSDYSIYQSELRTEDDRIIWQRDNLKPQTSGANKRILVSIPSEVLSPTSYKVVLTGTSSNAKRERVNTYYFRVEKE